MEKLTSGALASMVATVKKAEATTTGNPVDVSDSSSSWSTTEGNKSTDSDRMSLVRNSQDADGTSSDDEDSGEGFIEQ